MALNANSIVATIGYGGAGLTDKLSDYLGKMTLGVLISAPAAKGVAVHAAVAGTAAVAFPGPFTNPVVPRNVSVVFAAAYDGGSITVVGTDIFDQPQTEVIVAAAASTVVGLKTWKTVTSVARSVVGVNAATASLVTGDKLGITFPVKAGFYVLTADGVAQVGTVDANNNNVLPTTLPNGAVNYRFMANPK